MSMERFVQLARDYIALVEDIDNLRPFDFLEHCAQLLPEVYAYGMRIGHIEPATDTLNDHEVDSPMSKLMGFLGKYDPYHMVFNPLGKKKAITAPLSDDLADIYLDLKRPLLTYESGNVAEAQWHWRFNIRDHCGQHIVHAMAPIHQLVNWDMDPEYEGMGSSG